MDPDRAVCGERQGDSQRSRSQSAGQCDEDVEESQKRPPALVCRSGSQGMGSAKRGRFSASSRSQRACRQ